MDVTERARIRKRARLLHLVTQIVLIGAVVLSVLNGLLMGIGGRVFGTKRLLHSARSVWDVFIETDRQRVRDIVAFLPPADPDARAAWARRIQEHMQRPVAVFLTDGVTLHGVAVPEKFLKHMGGVAELLKTPAPAQHAVAVDTLGAMEIRRVSIAGDTSAATAAIVGPLEDSLRWGVVFETLDAVQPFVSSLARSRLAVNFERSGVLLQDELELTPPTGEWTSRTGLRVFIGDSLAMQTPGLDTTNQLWSEDWKRARFEYFLSDRDEAWTRLIGRARWPRLIASLFVFALASLALFRTHRWVRRLSAD